MKAKVFLIFIGLFGFCYLIGLISKSSSSQDDDAIASASQSDDLLVADSCAAEADYTYAEDYDASQENTSSTQNIFKEVVHDDDNYVNNRLSTGDRPYSIVPMQGNNDSYITVSTNASSSCDLVAIVKHNGARVGASYIRAGGSHTFYLPNGSYQVFFYGGRGWNPNKRMPDGSLGGFVGGQSFTKDNPQFLCNQGLKYELIPQANGNFNTEESNLSEIF